MWPCPCMNWKSEKSFGGLWFVSFRWLSQVLVGDNIGWTTLQYRSLASPLAQDIHSFVLAFSTPISMILLKSNQHSIILIVDNMKKKLRESHSYSICLSNIGANFWCKEVTMLMPPTVF